jgi:hypothetical protein
MTEIVLKPELLKGLQKVLVEYEPKNEDPILASQYLSGCRWFNCSNSRNS